MFVSERALSGVMSVAFHFLIDLCLCLKSAHILFLFLYLKSVWPTVELHIKVGGRTDRHCVFSNATVVLKMKLVFIVGAVLAAVRDRPLSKYPPVLPCTNITNAHSPCHSRG